jgi:hypothetical protein
MGKKVANASQQRALARRIPADVCSAARAHTKTAIKVLAGIMNQKKAPPHARVMAAEILLDRGWGKAMPMIEGPTTAREGIRRIVREIVFVKSETQLAEQEPPEEEEFEELPMLEAKAESPIIEGEAVELPSWKGNGKGFGNG